MTKFKSNLVNFFGSLGYLSCAMQWIWVVILYSSVLRTVALYFSHAASDAHVIKSSPADTSASPSALLLFFGVIVAVTMILLTIYVLVKIPSTITKTGKKVVGETAEHVAPFVLRVQHKKITEKNRKKLAPLLIVIIKLLLITISIALSLASMFLDKPVFALSIIVYSSLFLAGLSFVFFAFQYILAYFLSINNQDIR